MTTPSSFDLIAKHVDNYFNDITSSDYAFSHLKCRRNDSDEDWSEVAFSSDFRYYFEEYYFQRMPGRQPVLTDQEWSIIDLVRMMVVKFKIDDYCEDLAKELCIKAWDVHQTMIDRLWTFLIDTSCSIN